ncbi:hypothetical protein [Azospirillum sp. B506]|uniref:hypothetical protein n=1 Tax=Azospirillum sp. B506 TaxID=137721 RepID=UPI001FCA4C34|nr:hypothetical protein [Azospirillum sp. B506]
MPNQTLAEPEAPGDEATAIPEKTKARLRQILSGGHSHSAGAVQLIGLGSLRSQLGDRWDSVKNRIYDQTERLFNRYLPSSDVWLRADDSNYLVVFSALDRQAAELVSGRIVAELHRLMLGNADTVQITVRSVVTELDGNVSVEAIPLNQLIARAMQQGRAFAQSDAVDGQNRSADTATAQEVEVFHPSICYRPVFDASHKVLSTYVCHADENTKRIIKSPSLSESRREEYIFRSDLEILNKSIEMHEELHRNSFRYIQNMTVNISSLSVAKYKREYINCCHSISSHLIPFIVFVLQGVPTGVPYGRISEIATILKPYSRATLVLLDDGTPNLAAFAQAGIRGLGVTVQPGEPEARAANRLHTIGANVRRHGMIFFVDGIRTAAMLRTAEQAGASYIAGSLIGNDTDVPGHMKWVTERELIEKAAKVPRRP